jgi:hypothetical protein
MGTQELKPGDWVRVSRGSHVPGYLPGERGEVRAGPEVVVGTGQRYYFVTVRRPPGPTTAVFAEHEIEPDV